MKSSPSRILIADDDAGIIEALQVLFEDAGYAVKTTMDGANVHQAVSTFDPDVVLLDIWMSGQNGEDICRRLKTETKTKDLPVILVSANRDTAKISKECGADDFVAKPFDIDDILQKVRHYVH